MRFHVIQLCSGAPDALAVLTTAAVNGRPVPEPVRAYFSAVEAEEGSVPRRGGNGPAKLLPTSKDHLHSMIIPRCLHSDAREFRG